MSVNVFGHINMPLGYPIITPTLLPTYLWIYLPPPNGVQFE